MGTTAEWVLGPPAARRLPPAGPLPARPSANLGRRCVGDCLIGVPLRQLGMASPFVKWKQKQMERNNENVTAGNEGKAD